ncbi:hypothetical protein GCM10027436_11190 [Actinophytocola sediminis]
MSTGPGTRCWLPAPGDAAVPAQDRAGAHPPGSPVALGPADASPAAVRAALARLTTLVANGTETAGAGVELGGGFVSARLAGANGDRRDAVLAAMRVLGTDGAHRLGDRSAVLVALFGLAATKRVGAAANTAITDGRWAALQLASAVSDLLGPEQVEQVLALRAPDGVDPFRHGAASTLAEHLSRVLSRYPKPRRLTLVDSLWQHVCARLVAKQRLAALPRTQVRADRIDKLATRHREHFDAFLLRALNRGVHGEVTLADAARWQPPRGWTSGELRRLMHDAIAATALLRFARTMSDEGLAVAAARHRDELVAADACLTDEARAEASRRPPGAYSHPARPGRYVHDLLERLRPDNPITDRTTTYVRERVAMARNYGVVVHGVVTEIVGRLAGDPLHNCWDTCRPWQAEHLRQWRAAAGFARAPRGWEQPPLADAHADGPKETLAQRLAAAPELDPAAVEAPHDLLWYADLADALAPFYGHETAHVRHERNAPDPDFNPWRPPEEPRRPTADSVPLAAAEVAQLVAFGATPPARCGSWPELVDRISKDATVAEASVGAFPIPPELSDMDNQLVPGTALTVEVGREPRQLASWSSYMGNCIGESWYVEDAREGQFVLMALRAGDTGRIVANLDIRLRTTGWHVHELRARFNDDVDPALAEQVQRWVAGLAPVAPPAPAPALPPVRARGGGPRRAAGRLPAELIRALVTEVDRTLAEASAARRTYVQVARGLADFEPTAAVIALKRTTPTQRVQLVRGALDAGLSAAALWRATRVRPLAEAVARLDPGLRDDDRIGRLTGDEPLPRSLRALVRRAEIAPAYALDVVALAVRRSLGELVDTEVFPRSVARRPTPELVCALVIATTCRPSIPDGSVRLLAPGVTEVPGFPATDLRDEDGPWQHALPAAAELGAHVASFGEQGLLAPAGLLGKGGWPALWRRAHR